MKILVTALLSFAIVAASAQTDFNKWSIGASIGNHKALRNTQVRIGGYQPHHFGGNLRYMATNRFGIMGDLGYDFLDVYHRPGFEKNSHYFRISLQGVVNAGDLFRFDSFSNHIGLLFHGGAGVSRLWQFASEGEDKGPRDNMGSFIIGMTPQFKVCEKFSLNADFSVVLNSRQDRTYGFGAPNNKIGVDGSMINISIGASYYFGKNETHADWTPTVYGETTDNTDLYNRVKAIEEAMQDDDGDGVPNNRDEESDTPEGSYVNSKGEAIVEKEPVDLDKDKDGFLDSVDECPEIAGKVNGCPDRDGDGVPDAKDECPDEAGKKELNGCALSKQELDVIKQVSESIYFNTGKSVIKSESFEELDKLAEILIAHPEVATSIEGHTDNTGDNELNLRLSKERAAAVKTYLVSKGVSADRLQSEGYGSTKPVASNDTEEGRAQNRRVKVSTSMFAVKK